MVTRIRSLTRPALETMVRTAVREELAAVLSDPDFGLTIRPSARRRLLQSRRSHRAGNVRDAHSVFGDLAL